MHILIVKMTSMGDLVQALPALSDARQVFPDITFDWVADTAFAEIPTWHPAVNKVIVSAHRRWKQAPRDALRNQPGAFRPFVRQLRAKRYDAIIDAQTNIKSAVVTAMTRGIKHGPDKTGVREYPAHWAYRRRHNVSQQQHSIRRWRELFAKSLGYTLPNTPPDFGLKDKSWPATNNLPASDYIVGVPNASWPTKQWQDDHWRNIIALAAKRQLKVLLTSGSAAEKAHCDRLAKGFDNAIALPRKSLTEMAAIMLGARGTISVDTGLAHVSAALDIPTLTLYGPTDPALIGATGAASVHLVASGYDCIPCYNKTCEVAHYRGPDAQCLRDIAVHDVWQRFTQLAGLT